MTTPYGSSGHMSTNPSASWSPVSRVNQKPDPCDDNCTPRCPACGGLKCSCRPRFFPGQLLTDRELNGLEQYVVDKNRLHNTYLHGWGVACGLEVVCDDCDSDHVVVRTGYAVSPCGDDIVICNEQSVDVCALINQCQPREANCDNPYDNPPRDCTGGVKKWVLAVCYDERPTRGITAQLGAGDSPGCARCSCGGSCASGCGGSGPGGGYSGNCNEGCKEAATARHGSNCGCGGGTTASTTPPRQHKAQCEPTQICEGYRFIAYPAPKDVRLVPPTRGEGSGDLIWAWLFANRSRFGPLIERVLCCATKALELRQSILEGTSLEGSAALGVLTEYADALAELAADFAIHGCSFVAKTRHLRDDLRAYAKAGPALATATFTTDVSSRIRVLDETWMEIVSECVCSALLPGCPTPPSTNCVPLAVVTIDGEDCRVVDICNWSERKILITWPTISYWLSWLPWKRVQKWILDLCCGEERGRGAYQLLSLMFGLIFNQDLGRAKPSPGPSLAFAMGGPTTVGETFDNGGETFDNGGDAGSPAEPPPDPLAAAFNADSFLGHMLEEVARLSKHGGAARGQPEWMSIVSRVADGSILQPRPVEDPRIADLSRRLEAAESRLGSQAETLDSHEAKISSHATKLQSQQTKIAGLAKKGGK